MSMNYGRTLQFTFGAFIISLFVSMIAYAQQSNTHSKYQEEKEAANASTVTIISSSISSTYTRFAQDIQNVLDDKSDDGLRVLPILGKGGGQNIHDMLFLKGVDMGITDAAYLNYYKRKDPVLYENIETRIKYICKLLNAEYHLLVPKEIKNFKDLQGKKVSFWKQLSITSLASETIFELLGIDVEPVYLDNAAAIEKMRRGEISGVARMSGAPHNDYNHVTPDDGFHLLGFDSEIITGNKYADLMSVYLPAQLTSSQYPQLIPDGEKVSTVATIIVLGVYNWPEQTERYQKLAKFVERFFDNIESFRDPARHKKWAQVNIAANVSGWQRFKPAQEWLDSKMQLTGASGHSDGLRAAFEAFMRDKYAQTGSAAASPAERETLYREFSAWWNTRKPEAR